MSRSWGIGSGQSDKQRRHFEQQLQILADSLQKQGGPYLTGVSITLVRLCVLQHFGHIFLMFICLEIRELMTGTPFPERTGSLHLAWG